MKFFRLPFLAAVSAVFLLGGCSKSTSESAGKNPRATALKKLCWVQPLKGHPVHQLTQIAFREGCAAVGYECEIIGTDGMDNAGTIALAEQALARGDVAGMVVWATSPAYYPLVERAHRAGVPVVLPHFPAEEGSIPGATGIICCDPDQYARECANEIGNAIKGHGTIAITQGSFNSLENRVAEIFAKEIVAKFPGITVLAPGEEGFDPTKGIALASSLLQSHPEIVAAFSTTGGGPTTWAGAQRQVGRKIVAVGMDYTRLNLDLVKSGEIFAVVGQPLWDESFQAASLLDQVIRGGKIAWWTRLPAPFITKGGVEPYERLLDKVEAAIKK